jgi:SpoVK/Ycf46/Vps4 family AAA+-type ATPase
MPPDPDLFRALEAAVTADPTNAALRVHLAGLLLEADQPADALGHLELVLRDQPDHVEALGLAATAGGAIGDHRALGWARLHASLTGSGTTEQVSTDDGAQVDGVHVDPARDKSERLPSDDGDGITPEGVDWDRFLDDVLREAGQLPPVTLADVGGLNEVKDRLEQSFLAPLRNPELRRAYGTNLRGGLLLWGPPGCGKTFLARAVAGELGARFVSVGLHQTLDMWLGNSEKQLHQLFEQARRNTPCVLFFDELDAIGHSRINLGRSAARNVVAQLLVELDGIESSNEGIFVIGATNQPWDVDPALRRPGRFDRTMLLVPPDEKARAAILRYHLRDRPVGDVDFEKLAVATEGMSGADLRLICDDAAERALQKAIGSSSIQPIGDAELRKAVKSTRPSTSVWLESAKNHVRYANATGEYDELADYLRRRDRR